jgi:hypothetical protein
MNGTSWRARNPIAMAYCPRFGGATAVQLFVENQRAVARKKKKSPKKKSVYK